MAEARLFQALSDPTRLRIVGILAQGPRNVTGIVNIVKAAQPAVSRHLRILREVGLIHDRRLGKEVEYSLDAVRVKEACGWLDELAAMGEAVVPGRASLEASGAGDSTVGEEAEHGAGRRQEAIGREPGQEPRKPVPEGRPGPRPRRVSPLAARLGTVEPEDRGTGASGTQETPREVVVVGGGEAPRDEAVGVKTVPERTPGEVRRKKGAGIRAEGKRSDGKRPKPKGKQPRSKGGRGRKAERKAEPRPEYIVEREQDPMDDFLL